MIVLRFSFFDEVGQLAELTAVVATRSVGDSLCCPFELPVVAPDGGGQHLPDLLWIEPAFETDEHRFQVDSICYAIAI
mgnify:CR=1 FL=1|tara:strand:- start:304 stop:537 length:234 start_codon:yes stop_codon:yes gene_type:complete